jgi:hypothetical protein
MKRLRRLVSSLIQRLKQRPKIWRLSSIEVSFSYSKAKFKVGDEVLIKSRDLNGFRLGPKFKKGIILEVGLSPKLRGDSEDEFYYKVQYNPLEGRSLGDHKYTEYINENMLDYPLWKKREDKLKKLGI